MVKIAAAQASVDHGMAATQNEWRQEYKWQLATSWGRVLVRNLNESLHSEVDASQQKITLPETIT